MISDKVLFSSLNITKPLQWVCFRRDVYFAKVNKDGTSQTCPHCGAHTGKKTLDVRVHHCNECGYTTTRDVAASQEIRNRGISALLA
ncbi:MAG: zinc ribbon domain-containing protein [Crocosphaera sp.]